MLTDDALETVRLIRSRALARGDMGVVRECDDMLNRHYTRPVEDIELPVTAEAPKLENKAQPRPIRRR